MSAEKPKTEAPPPPDAKGKKGEASPDAAAPAKSGKKKMIGIIAGVMIVEGIAVFGAVKMLGGKPEPMKAEPIVTATQPAEEFVELEVAKIRAPNVKDGKLVLWSMEVVIRARTEPHKHDDKMKEGAKGEGEGEGEHAAKAEGPKDPKAMAMEACPELSRKLQMNERTIKDRLSRIIRSADPQVLQEDGLETIRRQVKFELERILEDEHQIVEVVIPECTPFPTGF